MATAGGPVVVWVDVEVPTTALTADDCDPSLPIPASLPEGTDISQPPEMQRVIAIKVPEGCVAGHRLRIPDGTGSPIEVTLPGLASPGDGLFVFELMDGTWRCATEVLEWAVLCPEGPPDLERTVYVPDGTAFSYCVPPGVLPGQIMGFHKPADTWAIKNVCKMPEIKRDPDAVMALGGPYTEVLNAIKQRGYLDRLPIDSSGALHVNIPFCAGFQEYAILGNFLADNCLVQPRIKGIRVLATELGNRYSFCWAIAERWFKSIHPKIQLQTCVLDSAVDPVPKAGLFIAVHPEVTKGGYWFQIMGSILGTCRGLCVFVTFYEAEMQTVLNMVAMYKKDAATIVIENPYYETHDMPEHHDMRYIIFVECEDLL